MTEIVCSQCNATLELVKGLTACPHCQQDIRRQIAQSKQLSLKAQMDQEEIRKEEKKDTLPYPEEKTGKDDTLPYPPEKKGVDRVALEDDSDPIESPAPDPTEGDEFPDFDAEFYADDDSEEDGDSRITDDLEPSDADIGDADLSDLDSADLPSGDAEQDDMETGDDDAADGVDEVMQDDLEDDDFDFEIETTEITSPPNAETMPDPRFAKLDDPMMTLPIPEIDDARTLGLADPTLRVNVESVDADIANENDSIQINLDAVDPDATLVVRPEEPENTIINPLAAREAAEQYSQGLNTVIPPRTISREANPGQIQDYTVQKRLGAGAFGVVFRAMQVPLERNVAVKVLQDTDGVSESRRLKLKNEFLREAQFTGRLEHPNIVPIHDIGLTITPSGRANPFYAMKEIRGDSWLDSIRTSSRRDNLNVFKSVANAIGFAHDSNIIHCDLKPDNVMVGEFGEVLVVDWGQAVDLANEATMRPGGTPAYISPEMAQYWCDIHLDQRSESPARELVGFRSDVYLLGALLFEIVTGSPPHCGTDNDSPYDIIRLAADNIVVKHDEHIDDELMQIALAAMRLGDKQPIETVGGLLAALEVYENRISSIELRQRAHDILELAKANSDYDEFQRARFGFEESLEKWSGNTLSKQGLLDARLSSAKLALKDQNFDLGIGILEGSKTVEEKEVKTELESGKSKRDSRKKLVRYLALGLVSSIVVGILANGFMFNRNMILIGKADEAVDKQAQAENATELAIVKRDETQNERDDIKKELDQIAGEVEPLRDELAKNQTEIKQFSVKLEQAESEYDDQIAAKQAEHSQLLVQEKNNFDKQLDQKKEAYDLGLLAEKKQNEAKLAEETKKFESDTKHLVEQKQALNQQVTQLNESSKLLRYKGDVTNAVQKLQSGDYRETRKLVDRFEDSTPWEVARLNLLAHREIEAIYPDQRLEAFAASADGTRFALLFDDQIQIRDTGQFHKVILAIPTQGATAVALSSNGHRIAIATPADSSLKPGEIQEFNVANLAAPALEQTLDAQSLMITHLEYSADDSQLLSVGVPSKLRKSSGNVSEKELMIWENGSPVDVKLIADNGQMPKFTKATFSDNGNRLLTTRPNALPMDQVVHVFEKSDGAFRWIETSPIGLNAADFENTAGTSIVASARDAQSGTYSLVSWPLDQSKSTVQLVSSSRGGLDSIRPLAQLDKMAICIRRYGDLLVTSGQDRKVTLWDWKTKTPKSFGGHARDVDLCMLRRDKSDENHVLISVSLGENPEILKTDLATFQTEVDEVEIGNFSTTDVASPSTVSRSQLTGQIAFGSDRGQASVIRNGQRTQWEITAWKNHVLSYGYLFAQSRDDYLYQFNRESGALERVLTKLNQAVGNEIVKLEVSDDGKTALLVSDSQKPEFHLWDLEQDQKIRTVNYGAENVFGTGTEKELLALTLSPDGKWVVGGKVGVFAWSTKSGQRKELTKSGPELARNPISSIVFLNPGTRFLVSWKDRIDLFDLNSPANTQSFNTKDIAYDKNEPNLFDARMSGNKILVLARSISKTNQNSGIVLTDLENGRTIATFESTRSANFSNTDPDSVFIVNKRSGSDRKDSIIEKWSMATQQRQTILDKQNLEDIFDGRFRNVEKVDEIRGQLTLQATTKSKNSSIQRDWNTISINPDRTIGSLRVFAKPRIQYHATTGNRSITLEQGTIRLWKLLETSVQPDGVIPGLFQTCKLSPDEKTLMTVGLNSNQVQSVDPISGEKTLAFQTTNDSPIVSIDWNANSTEVAVGLINGIVEVFQLGASQWHSTGNIKVTDTPISEISYSVQPQSLLATSKDAGKAFVVRRQGENWSHFSLAHVDGRQIVTGDISSDGRRVVTGSDNGQLTIWNSEPSADSASDVGAERVHERMLFDLQNKHQSPISFAKFLTGATGETNIVSAESSSDKNKILIWKTQTPKD